MKILSTEPLTCTVREVHDVLVSYSSQEFLIFVRKHVDFTFDGLVRVSSNHSPRISMLNISICAELFA